MNSGQTMLVILAMMLLGTLSLTVNRTLINSSSTSLEMEANLDAISIGQSMLDEILNKAFDENATGGKRVFQADSMSSYLGPDALEFVFPPDSSYLGNFKSIKKYDDVDDYNGYWRLATNPRLGLFSVTDTVCYVSENHPDSVSSSTDQTFCKRVTVVISSQFMTKDADNKVFPLVMRDIAIYRRYF